MHARRQKISSTFLVKGLKLVNAEVEAPSVPAPSVTCWGRKVVSFETGPRVLGNLLLNSTEVLPRLRSIPLEFQRNVLARCVLSDSVDAGMPVEMGRSRRLATP